MRAKAVGDGLHCTIADRNHFRGFGDYLPG